MRNASTEALDKAKQQLENRNSPVPPCTCGGAQRIAESEEALKRFRQRVYLVGHRKIETIAGIHYGSCHSTACTIWGDDGQGHTPERFESTSLLPCSCGALENFAKVSAEKRIAKLEQQLRRAKV